MGSRHKRGIIRDDSRRTSPIRPIEPDPGTRNADNGSMKRLPPSVERFLAGITLCLAFVLMASIFVPDFSQAEQRAFPPADPESANAPAADFPSLGTIENGRYRVQILVGDRGPLYSVFDAATGRELAVHLSADEVAQRFPDLPIPDMDFDALPTLSTAEPLNTSLPE